MGWRFSRRVKVLPGVTLNLSKSGVSTSVGAPGARVTIGHGKVRQTVGIPGTGISFTDVHSTHSPSTDVVPVTEDASASLIPVQESGWVTAGRILWKALYWLTIGIVVAFGAVLLGLLAGAGSSRRRR